MRKDSFTANPIKPIKTAKEFKQHAISAGIHCMYCHIPFKFDENMFLGWKRAGLFSTSIHDFVKHFKPYKDSLHETEQNIFSFVESIAKKSPDAKLDTVIKLMSTKANQELFKFQEPLFDSMIVEAFNLPKHQKDQIIKLVDISKKRILRIPHKEEFSGKEFNYRMMTLTDTLSNEKLACRINKLSNLLTIPALQHKEPLTDKVVKRVLRTINPTIDFSKNNSAKQSYTSESLQYKILETIKKEVIDVKRKDIYNLCLEGEKEIRGENIVRKFTNKALIYDLKEILTGFECHPSYAKLFEIVNHLPTSRDSIYAFITKHDQSSPEKIAYDLFTPSEVTLEHEHPSSLGGVDSIINYAVACKRCNNTRQHKDMKTFYGQFAPNNAQLYWDDIIREANKGYFDFEDVVGMLKTFKRQCSIKIDSSKLKYRIPALETE